MYALTLLLLVGLTILSFIPVLKLNQHRNYETFTPLRHTVSVVFAWATLTTVKFIIADFHPVLGYYMHLISYAVVLLIALNFCNAILHFIGQPLNKNIRIIGYSYFILFTTLLLLNDAFHLLIVEGSEQMTGLDDALNANVTSFFNVHVLIVYLLLGVPIGMLLIHLRAKRATELYKVPFWYFLGALFLGLVFNYIHHFHYTFYLDPTLVVVVLFAYLLFHLIYHRDMGFILMAESRKTLIDNMREMYIVTDNEGWVIDRSDELKERFQIDSEAHVDTILKDLGQKAILYEDIDDVDDKSSARPYLYTIKKTLDIEKTRLKGALYLFYDESRFVTIMDKLEYLQSHDEMTGLYNRNHFEQHLPVLQEKYEKAVILIADVNGLKLFNDHFGHKEGDRLIMRFANVVDATTNSMADTHRMRIGGDEFLIVIGNAGFEEAESLKKAIMKATYHPNPLKRISTSVGYAVRKAGEPLEATFLRADHALYTMKKDASKAYREAFMEAYRDQYESK